MQLSPNHPKPVGLIDADNNGDASPKKNKRSESADMVLGENKKKRGYSIDLKKKKLKASLYGDLTEEEYYRMKHPFSKIMPLGLCNEKEELALMSLRDQNNHRIRSATRKPNNMKTSFFNHYSNGPLKAMNSEIKSNKISRERAAIIIQRNWRGYKVRRTMKFVKSINVDGLLEKAFHLKSKKRGRKSDKAAPSSRNVSENSVTGKSKMRKLLAVENKGPSNSSEVDSGNFNKSGSSPKLRTMVSLRSGEGAYLFDNKNSSGITSNNPFNYVTTPPMDIIQLEIPEKMQKKVDSSQKYKSMLEKDPITDFDREEFFKALHEANLDHLNSLPLYKRKWLINSAEPLSHPSPPPSSLSRQPTPPKYQDRESMQSMQSVYPIGIALKRCSLSCVIWLVENGLNIHKCNLTERDILNMVVHKGGEIDQYLQLVFRQRVPRNKNKNGGGIKVIYSHQM